MFYLLLSDVKRRLLLDRKFYVAIMLIVLTGLVVTKAYAYHSRYDIALSGHKIVLEKQKPIADGHETIVDGYRRMVGDVRQIVGL